MGAVPAITSLANPRIKRVVKLRQRSHRDELGLMLVEGYREISRALSAGFVPKELFYCDELFLKNENEPALLQQAAAAGSELLHCSAAVFQKISYRDRPDGLLAVGPQLKRRLCDLTLPADALLVVAEAIEKPGNLGAILRSADAASAAAVIVCDRRTDIFNPNVIRASTGVFFSVPVIEASNDETLAFLRQRHFSLLAATPHTTTLHTAVKMTGNVALLLGTEQYGLSEQWLAAADLKVRIPMLGVADSLNVSAAATILLFEAVRQRFASGQFTAEG